MNAGAEIAFLLELASRRRATLIKVALGVFTLVALVTLLLPPVYVTTAQIMVQDDRAQLLVSPHLQGSAVDRPAYVANPVSEQDLNSERELLTSLYLVKQAIAGLPLPAQAGVGRLATPFRVLLALPGLGYRALHGTPGLGARGRWADDLEHQLAAWVIKRSDVITVEFRAHDPGWCKEFLSRLIDQYLAYHARISHDPQAHQFFVGQVRLANANLMQSEERLRQFEVQSGVTNLAEQKKALIDQMSQLEMQYNDTVAQLAAARREVQAVRSLRQAVPSRIGKEMRSVQNLALQQLKPEVMKLKAERAELLTRYQPTSQRIGEIDAKLAAAQQILNAEDHLEVQERSTGLNPIWVSLQSHLADARARVAALGARREALSTALAGTRQKLVDLVNHGVVVERLKRQVVSDREAYLSYVRKAEEARAAQALNLSRILNVSVVKPPAVPLTPSSPNVPLSLAVGLLAALAIGAGAAYLEEEADPKIYSAATIGRVSGLAAVAVLREGR